MIFFTDEKNHIHYIFITGNITKIEVYPSGRSLVYYTNGRVDNLDVQNTKILLKELKEY